MGLAAPTPPVPMPPRRVRAYCVRTPQGNRFFRADRVVIVNDGLRLYLRERLIVAIPPSQWHGCTLAGPAEAKEAK